MLTSRPLRAGLQLASVLPGCIPAPHRSYRKQGS